MKKKVKLLVTGLIIIFVVVISNITYSRYILTRNFGATISTAPFYFDAYTEEEKSIVIEEETVYFGFYVRNYIGNNVTPTDIPYEITLSDDTPDDFYIKVLPVKERKTENSKWDDFVQIELSPKLGKEIKFDEPIPITITVTSRKPYRKDVDITIFVYPITGLKHGEDYFYVDYKVEVFDGDEHFVIPDEKEEYDGISLDSVFGENRPFIENNTFSFDVKTYGNYIARVYENGNEITTDNTKKHPLGTDVIYTLKNAYSEIEIDDSGPSKLLLEDTFIDNDVSSDKYLVVKMTKKPTLTFDAHYALQRNNMAGRGASGYYNNDNVTDITPSGSWNWEPFGSARTMEYDKTKNNGTYSFTWTFQTNQGGDLGYGYVFDAFAINGEAITLPFVPRLVMDNDVNPPESPSDTNSTKKTILSDGTIVEVEYIKVWRKNNTNQRVYQVRISNTRSNLVVTNANLHIYRSNLELVPYSLVGINNLFVDGVKYNQSSVVTTIKNGVKPIIRFNLKNHYENPIVRYTNRHGTPFADYDIEVSEPDSEGYYTANVPELYTTNQYTIGLLYVEATPLKYAVQYDLNGVAADFPLLFDDNNERYYTIENSRVVTVSNKKPFSDKYRFIGWQIENSNSEMLKIGQVLTIDQIQPYTLRETTGTYSGINILKLKAKWEEI